MADFLETADQARSGEAGVLAVAAHAFHTGYGADFVELAEGASIAQVGAEVVDHDRIPVLLGDGLVRCADDAGAAPGLTIAVEVVDTPVSLEAQAFEGQAYGRRQRRDQVHGLEPGERVVRIEAGQRVGRRFLVPVGAVGVADGVPGEGVGVDLGPAACAVRAVAGLDAVVLRVGRGDAVAEIHPVRHFPVQLDIGREGLQVVPLQIAFVLPVFEGGVGRELLGALAEGDGGLIETAGPGDLLDPVGVDPGGFGRAYDVHDFRQLAVGRADVEGHLVGVLHRRVGDRHPLFGVGQADVRARPGRDAAPHVHVDLQLAFLAGFGRDEDDAVRAAGAVDGRGGRVLEDLDGLDVAGIEHPDNALADLSVIGGVHGAALHRDAVDDPEGIRAGRDGTDAADLDLLGGAWHTGAGIDLHAGCHALQGRLHGGRDGAHGILCLDGADRADVVAFLRSTVANHDHIVQEVGVVAQRHVDFFAAADRLFAGLITDGGENQHGVAWGEDFIVAVTIRESTFPFAIDHDIRRDDGLPVHAEYLSGHADPVVLLDIGFGKDDGVPFDSRDDVRPVEGSPQDGQGRFVLRPDRDDALHVDRLLAVDEQVAGLCFYFLDQIRHRDAVIDRHFVLGHVLGPDGKGQ